MTTLEGKSHLHVEADGGGCAGRPSKAVSGGASDSRSSTSSNSDGQSWHSTAGASSSLSATEIVGVSDKRDSSASECSVEVDLEAGLSDVKVHLSKAERDCRICHLSLDADNQDSGIAIELGCSCKDDLASAHKHCAEAWFKIKGNKVCEICGSTARNVVGASEAEMMEHWNEANDPASMAVMAPAPAPESRNFWQGHRFLNFLLACMVFAFVISWLFHFNVPS